MAKAHLTQLQLAEILKSPAMQISSNAERLKGKIADSDTCKMPANSQQGSETIPKTTAKTPRTASKRPAPWPNVEVARASITGNSTAFDQQRASAMREFRLVQARKMFGVELVREKLTVRIPASLSEYIDKYCAEMRARNRRVSKQAIFDEALCQWYADHLMP